MYTIPRQCDTQMLEVLLLVNFVVYQVAFKTLDKNPLQRLRLRPDPLFDSQCQYRETAGLYMGCADYLANQYG